MNNDMDLLTKAKEISEIMNSKFWEFGDILYDIYNKRLYKKIGYEKFVDYCDTELYCTCRTAQVAIKLHSWKCSISSDAAIEWAKTIPWSSFMLFNKYIDDSNWKVWRKEYSKRKPYEFKSYLRRWKEAMYRRGIIRLSDVKSICEEVNRNDDKISRLKNLKIEDSDVAIELGIQYKDIRKNAKFVRCHIPEDIYVMIVEQSKQLNITIEQEIADTLTAVYRQDDVRETG